MLDKTDQNNQPFALRERSSNVGFPLDFISLCLKWIRRFTISVLSVNTKRYRPERKLRTGKIFKQYWMRKIIATFKEVKPVQRSIQNLAKYLRWSFYFCKLVFNGRLWCLTGFCMHLCCFHNVPIICHAFCMCRNKLIGYKY